MKDNLLQTRYLVFSMVAAIGLLATGGCGKSEQAPVPPAPAAASESLKAVTETPKPAAEAVDSASKAAASTASDAPTAAQAPKPAANQAASAAASTAAAPAGTGQVLGILEKAKDLAKEGKYQDALKSVEQLRSIKLTADQQKTVDKLKTEIEALVAKKAAGTALGDVLGGKK